MFWTVHLFGGPQRKNHAAVAIGTTIFTIGGYRDGDDYNTIKPIDIHVLDTVKLKWWKLELVEDQDLQCVPFQRYGHTAVAHGAKIYLWGGRNDQELCRTLYCYDTDTLKWSIPNVSGDIPLPRDGHSACIIKSSLYIYGGFKGSEHQFSQDLYMLNLQTMNWSLVIAEGNIPTYRDFHTATAIGDRMYIFGGRGDRNAPRQTNNEIYCPKIYYFDTVTKMWICPTVTGPEPPARRSHSAFVHNGFLYIFGGFNRNLDLHFQDIYRYDPKSPSWDLIITKGTLPCARRRQICQVVNDRVFISGGASPNYAKPIISLRQQDYDLPEQTLYDLIDHDDLHVLDLNPSLKNMCVVWLWEIIKEKKVCAKNLCIPLSLKDDLAAVGPFEEIDAGTNLII